MILLKNSLCFIVLTSLVSAGTFVGSLSCCLSTLRANDYLLAHNYCNVVDGQCICQDSPTAVEKCSKNDAGIFAALGDCCTGANLIGFAYGCAFQENICTCPSSMKQYLSSCEFPGPTAPTRPPEPSTPSPGPPPAQCNAPLDVIFIVDASGSIGEVDFKKELTFVTVLASAYKIGPDDVRFGLVAFSDNAHKIFDLKDTSGDYAALLQAIVKAPYYSGGTNTHKALEFVTTNKMFGSNSGGRQNAPDIVIVVTDGQSENQIATAFAAKELRNAGVKIFAVGVGPSVDQNELLEITSSKGNVFRSNDFSAIVNILDKIVNETCAAYGGDKVHVPVTAPTPPLTSRPPFNGLPSCCTKGQDPDKYRVGEKYCYLDGNDNCRCQDVWEANDCRLVSSTLYKAKDECCNKKNMNGFTYGCGIYAGVCACPRHHASYLGSCELSNDTQPNGVLPADVIGASNRKCEAVVDIIFIVDASGSIGKEDFSRELLFVSLLAAAYKTGPDHARFGLVVFSDSGQKQFDLKDTKGDEKFFGMAVSKTPYYAGATNTDKALDFITTNKMFSSSSGGRPNAPDIVIIVTDGKSENQVTTRSAAARLQNADVKIFAVGVGPSVDQQELLDIAGSKDNVLWSNDFSVLINRLGEIVHQSCVTSGGDKGPAPVPTFMGKMSCCDQSIKPADFAKGHTYCKLAPGDKCICQDVPQALEVCELRQDEIFASVDECCNGAYLTGIANGCTYLEGVCICPSMQKKFIPSCEWTRSNKPSTDPEYCAPEPVNTTSPPTKTKSPVTTTTPATATTKPPVATTTPVTATTKPPVTTTTPATAATKPPVTTTTSALATTKPPVTTTTPATATTKSPVTTTTPATATTKTPVTTTTPATTTTKPPPTTTKPPPTITKPQLTTIKPPPTTTKLPPTTTKPPPTTTKPPLTTTKPPVNTIKPPVTTSTLPITTTKKPVVTTIVPTTFTAPSTRPPYPPPSVQPCRNSTKADIILVMDASSSIGAINWKAQVKFADEITQAFDVGPNDVRFAALIFNGSPTKQFDLKTYSDHESLSMALLDIQYPYRSGTNTHLALQEITNQQMFSSTVGGRDNAKDIVIVMTDGHSSERDKTLREAEKLRDLGVTLFAVGIGSAASDEELLGITNDSKHVLNSFGYSLLDYIKRDLVKATCESV